MIVMDVVKFFLRDHPEIRQDSAPTLIMLALKEKFPCR
jgi:Rap1a immunity proteins